MAIQITAEATGDLICNKVIDKIIKTIPNKTKDLKIQKNVKFIEIPKERYISPDKRQQIIDENRLVK